MPQNTYVLRNRGTMLVPLQAQGQLFTPPPPSSTPSTDLNSSKNNINSLPIRCCAPAHTTIEANTPFIAAKSQLTQAGLTYPILAKTLFADGSPSSHALAVVHSDAGLLKITQGDLKDEGLALPLLFEQYIDHGLCLFKVYVLGNHEVLVTRPSLNLPQQKIEEEEKKLLLNSIEETEGTGSDKDPSVFLGEELEVEVVEALAGTSPPVADLEKLEKMKIPLPDLEIVSRVSAYPRSRSWGKYDLAPRGHGVPVPPEWLWRGIASKIRTALGLSLFNFDLIVPLAPAPHHSGLVDPASITAEEGLVHLIDINYFPGIEKLPNYEALLVQFFNDLREKVQTQIK
jgi:inositol-1,3,4-trisphosphate 5/6-kinase / inositol-tetrakisphosphate 1-kinase